MIRKSPQLESHILICRWLAGVMAGESPDQGWSQVQASAKSSLCLEEIGLLDDIIKTAKWVDSENAEDTDAVKSLCAVESERVRLFETAAGGVPAPPFGSWWLDGQIMGQSTLNVAAYYEEFGLKPGLGPADHISAELEFLSVLIHAQLDERTKKSAAQVEKEFLAQLMIPWLGDFVAATEQATTSPFWTAIVGLIQSVVSAEHASVSDA